jgi:hypothetical protein
VFGPKCQVFAVFRDVYECVLSEGFAVGLGVGLRLGFWVWMVPVHGGVEDVWGCWVTGGCGHGCEHEKGIGWMPWRQEAMKDVARCENLGGAASGL